MLKIILIILIIAIPIYGIYGTILGAVNNNIGELRSGIVCLAITFFVVATIVIITKIENKSKKYLVEHFEEVKALSKKYASIANEYITKLKALDYSMFTASYNKTNNLIISFYWQQKPNLLLNKIYQYDGFKKPKSKVNLVLLNEDKAKKLTENAILELKNVIYIDNSWTDKYSLPCLIYFIIRNNILETLESQANNIIPKGRENYIREHKELTRHISFQQPIVIETKNEITNSEEQEQRNTEAMHQMQKEANCFEEMKQNKDLVKWQEEQDKLEQERIERERQENERIELEQRDRERLIQEKREREQKSIELLNVYKFDLSNKYSKIVFNFIEMLTDSYPDIFLRMFNNTETLQSSILVKPYKATSQLLKTKIQSDGLQFTESDNAEVNKKIQELTNYFIQGLKKRIMESGDYNDDFTFPALLYSIVRNNVIKYYRNEYLETYGYESLEELCDYISNPFEQEKTNIIVLDDVLTISRYISNNAITKFVYYYIYKNNIELSFVDTYKKIVLDMKQIFERKKKEMLENDLFGKHKKKIIVENYSPHTLSPIDRIDMMTGEQFEIFMEDYFRICGFKVKRTPLSGDYGIDLIIENDFSKIGVQVKCYSNKVTASAVQEVVTGLRHYSLSGGMVVTNNYFQPAAIQLAKDNGIMLWNRDKLIEKLKNNIL